MQEDSFIADDAGFNLLELMAVVAIIGILLMIAVASYAVSTNKAASVACTHNRRELMTAVQLFAYDHPGQATTIDDLAPYVKNFERVSHCPKDASAALVFHADTRDVTCPNHPE